MPGRKFEGGKLYRYGFNGKENDNDIKGQGNQQDYGMRIYDPRLVRFLSVDPITDNYPELTPYQFASNTPIQAIDLDGLEAAYINIPDGMSQEDVNGMLKEITYQTPESRQRASLGLDLSILGTFKGVIEALLGHDILTGEKANAGTRILNALPLFGFVKKGTKVVTTAAKVANIVKAEKAIVKSEKVIVASEKAIIKTKNALKYLREKAVREAWERERKMVKETGAGSREWTKEELKELEATGRVKGYHGHHIKSVKEHPELAGEVSNIEILKSDNPKGGGAKKGSEHYNAHYPKK